MCVPLLGRNGCCRGQDHCCYVHVCREVERDLPPPGLFAPCTQQGNMFFLELSCAWVRAVQPVEKNAFLPLSGNVMNG